MILPILRVLVTSTFFVHILYQFADGSVQFRHYVDLYHLDTRNGGLRVAPKLTSSHISPNNLQRMNVRLAVQVINFWHHILL